ASCGGSFENFPENPRRPVVTFSCPKCGALLSFTTDEIPRDGYTSSDPFTCSPDRSGAAAWVPPQEFAPSTWPPNMPKGLPPPPPESSHPFASLDSQVDRLRQLRDYADVKEEEFRDNPILLDALKRLVEREKRKIMGQQD